MTENSLVYVNFLEKNGLKGAEIKPLQGDASNRRYARIVKDNQKFMLMIAPPELEKIGPFINVDKILRNAGLNAPEIFAHDFEHGLVLLEDFGDDQFSVVLREKRGDEREMYGLAVSLLDFLPEVEAAADPELVSGSLRRDPEASSGYADVLAEDAQLPLYSLEKMITESVTFVDWFATGANREEFIQILTRMIDKVDKSVKKLVLLDYHADNLMWMPGREGLNKVGLLDFQDARIGHPAYDLASLLEDARRDVDKAIVTDILKTKTPDYVRDYFILAAQRNLKIVGYFHRLNKRDGKAQYLNYLPRVWNHLRGDLEYPALREMKEWMIKNRISG